MQLTAPLCLALLTVWVTLGLQHKSSSSPLIISVCLTAVASSVEMWSEVKVCRGCWLGTWGECVSNRVTSRIKCNWNVKTGATGRIQRFSTMTSSKSNPSVSRGQSFSALTCPFRASKIQYGMYRDTLCETMSSTMQPLWFKEQLWPQLSLQDPEMLVNDLPTQPSSEMPSKSWL